MDSLNNASLVSVIVPCFNYGRFLGEALDSVRAQTYTNWECILVDNGSTDNTKDVAESYVGKDKRFRYFFCENKGVSAARNFGIQNSIGEFILPLDSDDKIGPNYIEHAVKILKSNSSIKIVYCEAELFGEMNGKWKLPAFSMKQMMLENVIFCSALYRKSDYNKTAGYNESITRGLEDWDFWLRLLSDGGEVVKIPETNFYYRKRNVSRNNSLSKEEIKSLRKVIYDNHKTLYEKYFDTSDVWFELYLKDKAFREIELSKEYRLGKLLLSPVRKLMSLFN